MTDNLIAKMVENTDFLFDDFFELLMDLEGGEKFTNRKADKGGATKYGITQYLLNSIALRDKSTPLQVQDLTEDQAKEIYHDEFYKKVKSFSNSEVHYNYFDMCVNSGYSNYKNMLNRLKHKGQEDSLASIYDYRENYYKQIPNQHDIKGWFNRLDKIKKYFKKG